MSFQPFALALARTCAYYSVFALRFLKTWPPAGPIDALELLGPKFPDAHVRDFAVTCLESLSDEDLLDYLLLLVQALKYEQHHDSALARFLLRRALRHHRVGHFLFWYLRGEMHVPEVSQRFSLLLEAYLNGCTQRSDFKRQALMLRELVRVALAIKAGVKSEERKELLHAELKKMDWQNKEFVRLPLDPR